jgi:hypothetical protein
MAPEGEEYSIRRIAIAASVTCVVLVAPRTLFAAPNLALPHSDYPKHSRVAVLPATNLVADRYFGPVHRSSFDALHRIDGAGWVQAAIWHFTTGEGGARRTHQTVFAYAINVYPSRKDARAAVHNVKVKTVSHRVSRIFSHLYQSSDGRETLVFLFFAFHNIEIESYYEYHGTAPTQVAKSLRALFNRQSIHLAAAARKLQASINSPPPPPQPSSTPVSTATSTPEPTMTAVTATSTATPTATPAPPTATPLPSPTPTATPVPELTLTASSSSPSYAPNTEATVTVQVRLGESAVAGAQVAMAFDFPGSPGFCTTVTDAGGGASCSVNVPPGLPNNYRVNVSIAVHTPSNGDVNGSVSFLVTQ